MTEKRLKFCGWGYEGDGFNEQEEHELLSECAERFGAGELERKSVPRADEITLPTPRVAVPAALNGFCTSDAPDRLTHTYGKAYLEYIAMFDRDYGSAPDIVAYARNEDDIDAVFDWASGAGVAVIPFGGATSVVRGIEPDVGGGYAGTLSLDLTGLDAVLEIDRTSRAARLQAGIRVPALEAKLKPHGLTLRHFPQSFELATLGGMIATRSGGHFATLYTHIDDFVESLRTLTPAGPMESRRLPGSGAGPSPDRMMIGSEGALGVITEAWMRLQDRPSFRAGTAVLFADPVKAVEAVRRISQAGLYPANVRWLDAGEAAANGFGDGAHSVVVLAFESADHPVEAWMERATEICRDFGGTPEADAGDLARGHRAGAAGAWREAFIRMVYRREVYVSAAIIADTFETATTWDRFPEFYQNIKAASLKAIEQVTGCPGRVTCRFTHVYPDGPAPYFSFQGLGRHGALAEQWLAIKGAACDAIEANGGTVTHHHAVGRDHMPWYEQQIPDTYGAALAGAKARLDPAGILNPGVLLPPQRT